MTESGDKNRPDGSSTGDESPNTVDRMTDTTENQTTTDPNTNGGDQSTALPAAPGGNPANRENVANMGAPELRTAVIELLTIIDDSDDMNVIVTVSDDGTVVVEAL